MSAPTAINTCDVTASLETILGTEYVASGSDVIQLYVASHKPFFHGNNIILPFGVSADFDGNGDVSLTVIETETPNHKLDFLILIPRTDSFQGMRVIKMKAAIVPDLATEELIKITEPFDFDLGF